MHPVLNNILAGFVTGLATTALLTSTVSPMACGTLVGLATFMVLNAVHAIEKKWGGR
jgi:hypothetical protein